MPEMKHVCLTCSAFRHPARHISHWSSESRAGVGECHANPPTATTHGFYFPEVSIRWGCRDGWKPASQEQLDGIAKFGGLEELE
jgi:hypothetical protein